MTALLTPSSVAEKATRLVAASERQSYDPFTEIDWDVPLDDSAFYLPPEFLPLYGTAVWDAMTEVERHAYSRHECASLCSAGIWFENILMHLLVQHLYDLPADDGSHRYLLVETADECRHSSMFGEFIRRAGTPAYTVKPLLMFGGRYLKATTKGPEAYIAMLAAEELLDVTNRATMKDERVHPTSRRIAKIHVMEEARHVSYARTFVTEMWPTVSRARRVVTMVRAPFIVSSIADALVNPQLYDELGIEGGVKLARHNPAHQQRVIRDVAKLTELLEEIGVINTMTRPVWRALGLIARADRSNDVAGRGPTGAGPDERTDVSGREPTDAAGSPVIDLTAAADAAASPGGRTGALASVVGTVAVGPARAAARAVAVAALPVASMLGTARTLAGGTKGFRLS